MNCQLTLHPVNIKKIKWCDWNIGRAVYRYTVYRVYRSGLCWIKLNWIFTHFSILLTIPDSSDMQKSRRIKSYLHLKSGIWRARQLISVCSNTVAAITICSTSTYARFQYWMIDGILFLWLAHCFKLNWILPYIYGGGNRMLNMNVLLFTVAHSHHCIHRRAKN